LSTPTAVKVAEIAPWIYYSRVKPGSLKLECILDLASPWRIILQNLLKKQQGTKNSGKTALLYPPLGDD
jgi:hypothetical protein